MRPAVLTAVLLSVLFINAVTSLNLGNLPLREERALFDAPPDVAVPVAPAPLNMRASRAADPNQRNIHKVGDDSQLLCKGTVCNG
uniref:Secreted protein n=1 Tax=Gasterosteus aculeatus TaxID=69293 RepID=G3Q3S0_GASAC